MKFLVAIVVVGFVAGSYALTDEQIKKGEAHAAACAKETNTPPETAAKLKTGDLSGSDQKTKCFVKCFFEKAGFMDTNGKIQEQVIVDKLSVGSDKAKVQQLVKKCNVKGTDACDTAFKSFECYTQNKAKVF
uniref:Putative odorant-binding protein 56e obp n=1 Tax=Corethrella appendiculata TaxID=1370023 RepID=U5EN91_9DIPT